MNCPNSNERRVQAELRMARIHQAKEAKRLESLHATDLAEVVEREGPISFEQIRLRYGWGELYLRKLVARQKNRLAISELHEDVRPAGPSLDELVPDEGFQSRGSRAVAPPR